MRIIIVFTTITVVLTGISRSFAGREPSPPVKPKDLVRMSTHVLIGTIANFRVIESTMGQRVPKPAAALRPGQMIEIEVVMKEILQQPDNFLSGKERLKVRFGMPQMNISLYRDQLLPKGEAIFFLCRNPSYPFLGDFFPFYGSSNMCLQLDRDSRDKELEVRAWVEKIGNLK